MLRKIEGYLKVIILALFCVFAYGTTKVSATSCTTTCECASLCAAGNVTVCSGTAYQRNIDSNCSFACSNIAYDPTTGLTEGNCTYTQDDPGQDGYQCTDWGGWSACVGGYQSRT